MKGAKLTMRSHLPPNGIVNRNYPALFRSVVLAVVLFGMLSGAATPLLARQQDRQSPALSEQQLEQIMVRANTQHSIVVALIEQGRFDMVLAEMRKIYELNLPDQEEDKIASSAMIVAVLLVDKKQMALAHKVLDEAFVRMDRNMDKATVLYVQARVYKEEGNLDKALEVLKQAQAYDKASSDKAIKK